MQFVTMCIKTVDGKKFLFPCRHSVLRVTVFLFTTQEAELLQGSGYTFPPQIGSLMLVLQQKGILS